MGAIGKEVKEMNFVPKRLDLPLFLMSRACIKNQHLQPVQNYIARQSSRYTNRCNQENATKTATTDKWKHLTGLDYAPAQPCRQQRLLRIKRDLISVKPWQLPPNLYNVQEEPYARRKGCSGAYWKKMHTNSSLLPQKGPKVPWKFYDVITSAKHCNRYKGTFLTNARHRRATSRSMVTDRTTCYHDPTEPGPDRYSPTSHFMANKISSVIKIDPPNPFNFVRHTTVPVKPNACHPARSSFLPGPGRYDIRFCHSCPCSRRLIFMPGLQLLIDTEKRKKFRRLPYRKIKARLYCSPDWRHVAGHGHRHLFRRAPRMKPRLKAPKDVKKSERHLQLFPDARYIAMITNPSRMKQSRRAEPLVRRQPRVFFNCLQKRVVRRQLNSNKKIAFNSGQDRFKDIPRAPILTVSQLEKVRLNLPEERQLRDHPVMQKQEEDITSKLHETPKHMMPAYEVELRKRLFKFLPLPSAIVLVTDTDTRPGGPIKGFFSTEVDTKQFFKDDVKLSTTKK